MARDSQLFGMDNRLAAQLQVSRLDHDPNDYPYDTVPAIVPTQGAHGPEFSDTRNRRLDDIGVALEDRLKIMPAFALRIVRGGASHRWLKALG